MDLFTFYNLPFLEKLPLFSRAFPRIGCRSRDQWIADYYVVLQFGSDNLVQKAEVESSLIRLFKASAFWLFLLAAACLYWLRLVTQFRVAMLLSSLIFALALATTLAFAFQRARDRYFITGAARLLRRMSLAPPEDPHDGTAAQRIRDSCRAEPRHESGVELNPGTRVRSQPVWVFKG
jgi:hypothetical protein